MEKAREKQPQDMGEFVVPAAWKDSSDGRLILSRFDLDTDEYELRIKALGPSDRPGGPQEKGLEIFLDSDDGQIRIVLDPASAKALARVAAGAGA